MDDQTTTETSLRERLLDAIQALEQQIDQHETRIANLRAGIDSMTLLLNGEAPGPVRRRPGRPKGSSASKAEAGANLFAPEQQQAEAPKVEPKQHPTLLGQEWQRGEAAERETP
jgi:hypothetical protein